VAAACVVVALIVVAVSGLTTPAGAADPTPQVSVLPSATAAAAWLAGEVSAGGDALSNGISTDWGLTADAVLALVAVNGPSDAVASAAVTKLLANISSYTTFADQGVAGVQLAGPVAKSLLAAEVAGHGTDPVALTLATTLRSLLTTTGRFSDLNPTADASNGFGQADAILALARTVAGVPTDAVDFLISQQCPDGGFRLLYSGGSCTDSTQADTDATAMAVQGLLAVTRTPAVGAALSSAVGWLESIQDPATGSFSGTGPTASANTNSAGLIAEALRAAGATAPANAAAAWITTLQLTAPAADAGAIAYDPTGLAAASAGIPSFSRDQWHRATAQALLALDVAPLGSIGAGGAPLPAPVPVTPTSSSTTSSTSTTSTTTTTLGPTTTTTTIAGSGGSSGSTNGGSSAANSSDAAAPVQVRGESTQQTNLATTVGSSSTSATNALARTGDAPEPLVALGLMALLLGLAMTFAVRYGDWPA
jgi:hypothetical protein